MPLFSSQRSVNGVFSARKKAGAILPFLTRQVITTGYVAAGYRAGVAWRNVNTLNMSTDTTTSLGDILTYAGNYTKGAQNKNNAFVFSTNGTGTEGVGAFTTTSCYSMRNNTTYARTSGMDLDSTFGDGSSIYATATDGSYTYAYANGNTNNIKRWNTVTETFSTNISTGLNQGGTGTGAHMGEKHGYWWAEGGSASADAAGAAGQKKFVFATETESTSPGNVAYHGQQKGMPAKTGFGYGGNEGTYGAGRYFRKWNYTTEVTVSTPQKQVWFCGEENYVLGQDAGYALGVYSDTGGGNVSAQTQVNDSGKFLYATDSGSLGASSMWPKGTSSGTGASGDCCGGGNIAGRSSGVGAWRD